MSVSGGNGNSRGYVKQALITGFAIVVPVLLTLFILMVVVDFVSPFLAPGVIVIQDSLGATEVPVPLIELLTALAFLLVVFVIGAAAESQRGYAHLEARFESVMKSIPGIGSIYGNINEISDLLLEQDTESFEEVKLIEYPQEGSYILGFLTAEDPAAVEAATDRDDVTTFFAPMGPNPFMGGFVIHVSEEQVYDIDLSVEEGIQSIVSSGVAINDPDDLNTAVDGTGDSI